MILRFMSASSSPEYLGINTEAKTYTTKPEAVKDGFVITVSCEGFNKLMREVDFNCYDYNDDLLGESNNEIPEEELLPF